MVNYNLNYKLYKIYVYIYVKKFTSRKSYSFKIALNTEIYTRVGN